MDLLQLVIITFGLVGQVLIARKSHTGYLFWIFGNIALMFAYHDLHQYGLVGLQVVNTAIQMYAIAHWIRQHRQSITTAASAI